MGNPCPLECLGQFPAITNKYLYTTRSNKKKTQYQLLLLRVLYQSPVPASVHPSARPRPFFFRFDLYQPVWPLDCLLSGCLCPLSVNSGNRNQKKQKNTFRKTVLTARCSPGTQVSRAGLGREIGEHLRPRGAVHADSKPPHMHPFLSCWWSFFCA